MDQEIKQELEHGGSLRMELAPQPLPVHDPIERRTICARLAVDSGAKAGAITRIAAVIEKYITTGEAER